MAIYAVQGLFSAGCLYTTYNLLEQGLNLPFFTKSEGVLNETIKEFVDSQAIKMGLTKEVVVISIPTEALDWKYVSYGNTWLPGKVAIKVDFKVTEDNKVNFSRFGIAHQIVHIKANDHLIIPVVTLAAALTTFVLAVNRDLLTRYLGGLGAALMTFAVLMRRAERNADQEAMKQCSKEVNQAWLNGLLERRLKGPSLSEKILEPSIDEMIGYFQAHLDSQK